MRAPVAFLFYLELLLPQTVIEGIFLLDGVELEALAETQVPNMLAPLRRAANDAASLAWLEPQPLLVFPELFLEKRRLAHNRGQQQQRIRNRTARLLEVFA